MDALRFGRRASGILLFVSLLALLVGCGSLPTANAGTNATATAVATACTLPRINTTIGTLKSIDGTTLLVTNLQGKDVKATYTKDTRIMRQAIVAASELKAGTFVSVIVTQNADNTYTATRVTVADRNAVRNQRGGTGFGAGARNPNCPPRNNGTPGAGRNGTPGVGRNGTPGAGRNANARSVNGTVAQASADKLTVTETNGSDYTVTLDAKTQITQVTAVEPSALQAGMNISLTGMPDQQGVVAAQNIIILLPGANGRPGAGA